ncbi:MAG: TIGR04222 domain-containing membrane protein [Vitreoscilla sp.]
MNASEPAGSGHPRAIQLLERIEAHGFDAPDDPLGFETRLADDNGWTLGHARAVVAEYRRFLVLTQLAKDPVSPSPDVDQAWHLHLTRTAHYAAFCEALFGRFLHHEPGRADGGDAQRHRQMYEYTRKVYRRGFGEAPPEPVWPHPGRPLPPDPAPAPRWAVPEALQPGRRLGWACVALALALCLLPGATRVMWPLMAWSIEAFLIEAVVVAGLLAWVLSRTKESVRQPHRRDTLDPYEVAWFGGGAARMAMTGIAALVERGVLVQPAESERVGLPRHALAVDRGSSAPARHPVEAACLRAATDAGLRFADACTGVKSLADACERRLAAAGLVAGRGTMPLVRARALALFTLWLAVCFGRCRLAFVEEVGHPGGTLVLVALAAANVLLLLRLARRPTRVATRAQGSMKALSAKYRQARTSSTAGNRAPITGDALALGVALVGTAAFAGDERFAGLDDKFGALGLPARQLVRRKKQEDEAGSGFGVPSGIGSAFGGVFGGSCGSPGVSSCGSPVSAGSVDGGASWDSGETVDLGGGGSSSCSGGSSCGSSCSGGSSCGGGGSSD